MVCSKLYSTEFPVSTFSGYNASNLSWNTFAGYHRQPAVHFTNLVFPLPSYMCLIISSQSSFTSSNASLLLLGLIYGNNQAMNQLFSVLFKYFHSCIFFGGEERIAIATFSGVSSIGANLSLKLGFFNWVIGKAVSRSTFTLLQLLHSSWILESPSEPPFETGTIWYFVNTW